MEVLIRRQRLRRGFFFLYSNCLRQAILCFQLVTELLGIQTIVMSTLSQQLGVGALLGDLSILDNDNSVCTPDG